MAGMTKDFIGDCAACGAAPPFSQCPAGCGTEYDNKRLELALARRDALLRRCLMPLNMLAVSDSDPLYKQLEADVKAELGDSHE